MLLSIVVYSFIIIALYYLFKVNIYRTGNRIQVSYSSKYITNYYIGIAILVFFLAFRWNVGRDYFSYLSEYMSIARTGEPFRFDMEPGFVLLMKIFALLGCHFTVFYGFVALIQSCFTLSYFKYEKYLLPYFAFAIMTANIFFMWSNIMRHTIVIAVFLYVSRLMMEKKRFWLYSIVVILMASIHYSALLLLPLYTLFLLDLKNFYIDRKWQLILFFSSLILASLSLWHYLLNMVDIVFNLIGYERYSSELLLQIGGREMNFGPRRIIFLLIDFIIILYSNRLRKTFKTKTFGFALILFVVYYTFMPLFMDNMAFSRIVDYFQIGRPLMCSYLLFYLFRYNRKKKNFIIGVLIVLLLCLHLFIQIYSDTGLDCIRYQFCFGEKIPYLI